MTKNEAPRPRSKRAGKEKNAVADEMLQRGTRHGHRLMRQPASISGDEGEGDLRLLDGAQLDLGAFGRRLEMRGGSRIAA